MRAATISFLLGTSVAYAGCVVDVRDNNPAESGSAGMTQGSSATTGSDSSDTLETTTGVSEATSSSGGESTDGADTSGGLILDVAPDETGGVELAEVFGHSGDVLYRLDPETLDVVPVGDFSGCGGSVIDIALDEDSNMFGVTFDALYEIDRVTAQCTLIADGQYPTSLSFVPAGTVDANEEALVGFVDDAYVRIDKDSGNVTNLGTLSDGLRSSGDVVSVKDGGTYLTVFGPACEDQDCIIEFNPANGQILENFGPIPYDQVFGLAFWAGKAYGFARSGEVFEVEFFGDSVSTTLIPVPNAPAGLEFFGAGSTTSAPPVAG